MHFRLVMDIRRFDGECTIIRDIELETAPRQSDRVVWEDDNDFCSEVKYVKWSQEYLPEIHLAGDSDPGIDWDESDFSGKTREGIQTAISGFIEEWGWEIYDLRTYWSHLLRRFVGVGDVGGDDGMDTVFGDDLLQCTSVAWTYHRRPT